MNVQNHLSLKHNPQNQRFHMFMQVVLYTALMDRI